MTDPTGPDYTSQNGPGGATGQPGQFGFVDYSSLRPSDPDDDNDPASIVPLQVLPPEAADAAAAAATARAQAKRQALSVPPALYTAPDVEAPRPVGMPGQPEAYSPASTYADTYDGPSSAQQPAQQPTQQPTQGPSAAQQPLRPGQPVYPGQPVQPDPYAGAYAASGHEDLQADAGDSLADELARDFATVHTPTATIPIPGRDGWALRFRLDWSEAKTREWKKRAKDPQAETGVSLTKLYRVTILDQCTALLKRRPGSEEWQPVTANGQVLNLRDPRTWSLLKVHDAQQAVHQLLPIFTQLAVVGQGLARAAGQEDLLDPFVLD